MKFAVLLVAGEFGRRETSITAKTAGLPDMWDAARICAEHNWRGYIRWRSYDGARETDPCAAMQPADEAPIVTEEEKKKTR